MFSLFDSHAHYYDARFTSDECPEGPELLLDRLFSSGALSGVINIGVDLVSTKRAIAQASRYPGMYVAAGFHPTDAMQYEDMEGELTALRALIADPANKIVAVGEIGFDYHYEDTDRARQARWFDAQMRLATSCGLPVCIHDRDAHGDSLDMVRAHPAVRGVFHSYSGSAEMALDLLRRGWYISFSGTVTFKNAKRLAEVATALPHDRVLIETDCPYLAPHPHRGQINHSGYLSLTAAKLGEIWGMPVEEVARITEANAKRLFGIS